MEALLKGINLALKRELKNLHLTAYSATVYAWVSSVLTKDRRLKTHGLIEALVQRWLDLLQDRISQCDLIVQIELVRSSFNKEDCLT